MSFGKMRSRQVIWSRSARTENPPDLWRRRIYQAVMELEVKIRTVMILYYYRDYSVKEIAALTGSFEGTVKSRLYAGRKMLKGKLADGKLQKMEAGRVHG